jgi:hypothetical protein
VHALRTIVAALLFAAAQSGHAAQPAAQQATPTSTPASAPACPAQDISFFIQRFSTDESVQRVFTADPLINEFIDTATVPEPTQRTQTLDRDAIVFPVMPLAQERAQSQLQMQLEDVTQVTARLVLFKPDTDYQISYFFKLDDCWRLVRIDSASL